MTPGASELAAALGERAEEVCRRLLPAGRRSGRYWTVGDIDGAKGRSMWVRLEPPGRPGKWVDAATGEHGDLLDLIGHRLGGASFGAALEEARAILSLPAPNCVSHSWCASVAERTAAARRLWRACRPVAGTCAEAYLRSFEVARVGVTSDRDARKLVSRGEERKPDHRARDGERRGEPHAEPANLICRGLRARSSCSCPPSMCDVEASGAPGS